MTDHLRDAAISLSGMINAGILTPVEMLGRLVDEGYIAILPRQPTLPTLEAVSSIEPTGDPKGYASVLVQEINHLTGRNFGVTPECVAMAKKLIAARVPLEQARQAIKQKHTEWGVKPDMAMYIRPSTLLRPSNMKKYIEDLKAGPVKPQAAHTFKQLGD